IDYLHEDLKHNYVAQPSRLENWGKQLAQPSRLGNRDKQLAQPSRLGDWDKQLAQPSRLGNWGKQLAQPSRLRNWDALLAQTGRLETRRSQYARLVSRIFKACLNYREIENVRELMSYAGSTHDTNADASYDFSSNDPYPYPRYTDTWFNSHGTRCAGEVSAARDNNVCGVGVAYGSMVAGLRMLDQPFMTDLIEANAMGHMPNVIDIYSASWGPTDDGKTVDGPRNLTMRAIVNGVNNGRHGKGNIYVWASGDGGPNDDCNCDGYAASMWTISINSATNDGRTAGYDESCSSTLASTFSNGKSSSHDAGVIPFKPQSQFFNDIDGDYYPLLVHCPRGGRDDRATTDLYNNCTASHSGTSAAAPEAAGVFALALEANNNLTWRDIQHLTVLTSKRNSLYDSNGVHKWQLNGARLEFNHLFGYGVLDAAAMVDLASQWKGLPERFHCTLGTVDEER
ncbi:hypothetical protein BaRGS_00003944, partial [Batillaria attramentaria]